MASTSPAQDAHGIPHERAALLECACGLPAAWDVVALPCVHAEGSDTGLPVGARRLQREHRPVDLEDPMPLQPAAAGVVEHVKDGEHRPAQQHVGPHRGAGDVLQDERHPGRDQRIPRLVDQIHLRRALALRVAEMLRPGVGLARRARVDQVEAAQVVHVCEHVEHVTADELARRVAAGALDQVDAGDGVARAPVALTGTTGTAVQVEKSHGRRLPSSAGRNATRTSNGCVSACHGSQKRGIVGAHAAPPGSSSFANALKWAWGIDSSIGCPSSRLPRAQSTTASPTSLPVMSQAG